MHGKASAVESNLSQAENVASAGVGDPHAYRWCLVDVLEMFPLLFPLTHSVQTLRFQPENIRGFASALPPEGLLLFLPVTGQGVVG